MQELTPVIAEVLEKGGSVELTVTGNSMRPMLWDRESRVRLAAPERLRRGDIPLYRRRDGTYVLHRIVAVENEGAYTCCGDNQWRLEPGVRERQVAAAVTDFTWRGRWVSCASPLYGLYWRSWVALRPVRRLIFGGLRRLWRVCGCNQ